MDISILLSFVWMSFIYLITPIITMILGFIVKQEYKKTGWFIILLSALQIISQVYQVIMQISTILNSFQQVILPGA